MTQAKKQSESATGVSNPAYDAMTVLTNKLQSIAVIEQYKQDAQDDQELLQCFEQIQEREREDVDKLRGLVAQRLQQ
jgi:cell fate (sporulation/competence/biofilm development) regulator YmcA (YheA/YmcA/DUF963 family)